MNARSQGARRAGRLLKRRLEAAEMFAAGARTAEVARRLQVTWRTAHRWRRAFEAGGPGAMEIRGRSGRAPLLDALQRRRLAAALRSCAADNPRIDHVRSEIARLFGIECSRSSAWRVLRRLRNGRGLSAGAANEPSATGAGAPA